MSTLLRIKLALAALGLLALGVVWIGFVMPFGSASARGAQVLDVQKQTVTMERGGESMGSHDEFRYELAIDTVEGHSFYVENASGRPRLQKGQRVQVVCRQKGMFGAMRVLSAQ